MMGLMMYCRLFSWMLCTHLLPSSRELSVGSKPYSCLSWASRLRLWGSVFGLWACCFLLAHPNTFHLPFLIHWKASRCFLATLGLVVNELCLLGSWTVDLIDSRLVNFLLLRLFSVGPKNQRLGLLLATVVVGATLTMVALANQIENCSVYSQPANYNFDYYNFPPRSKVSQVHPPEK